MADTIRNVVNTNRRHKIESFLTNLRKFAVDSAVNVSLKGGKKVYKILQDRAYKDDPNYSLISRNSRSRLEDDKVKEEKQVAKMEDVKAEVKVQSQNAGKVGGSADQGIKEFDLQIPNRNRIFIRSRL